MIINKIVASSWYLSSFSYMMHGHTYITFYVDLSKAGKGEAKHQISCFGMRVILKTNYCITDRVFMFNGIHSVHTLEEIGDQLH